MTAGVAPVTAGRAIVTVGIKHEHDVVLARQRARQIAEAVGFDSQEQVRFATAVSELARNAFQYAGGGRVQFSVEAEGDRSVLVAHVSDTGRGIADVSAVLQGRYRSTTGMGLGILGARRLTDRFAIESVAEKGTSVTVGKVIGHAKALDADDVARIAGNLAKTQSAGPYEELQRQNQELIAALHLVQQGKLDVERLNQELEETNRGVVALYAELDDRAEQMRMLSETKTRFLSDMSHELRTPLTSIINLARILLERTDGELSAEQERQVSIIQRSTESLAEMVNDLLDIAKIESGRVEMRADVFTCADLFAGLRGMFRPVSTNERVSLVFDEPAEPFTLHTDELRVSQVLRNFIANALKFTTQGEVRIFAERRDGVVRFAVQDTGIGIAPADRERIFEDFTQVDGPIQRRVRGTGLGLPITRKLAGLLGGKVTLESEVGRGSTFALVIPDGSASHG